MLRAQRYVSDELTHFVGQSIRDDLEQQYGVLLKIIREGWITHAPHDLDVSGRLSVNLDAMISENEMYSPGVVCFCDIPADDLALHASKYGRFGLAFRKNFLTAKGANPVFYVANGSLVEELVDLDDLNSLLVNPLNGTKKSVGRGRYFGAMVRLFHEASQFRQLKEATEPAQWAEQRWKNWRVDHFLSFSIFSFIKCFDESKRDQDPTNYYMEREWRVFGNVQFSQEDISRVILPEEFAKRFRTDVPEYYKQLTFI